MFRRADVAAVLSLGATLILICFMLVTSPREDLPAAFLLGLIALLGLASLFWPTVPLHVLFLTAAAGGFLRSIDGFHVGNTVITISGIRWGVLVGILLMVMTIQRKLPRPPYFFYAFLPFLLFMTFRWFETGRDARGLKDLLFYTLPLLVGTYTVCFLQPNVRSRSRNLRLSIFASAAVPVVLFILFLSLGMVKMTANGPKGAIGARPIATYLLLVLAVALSMWRYRTSRRKAVFAAFMIGFIFLMIVLSASRTAAGVAILLLAILNLEPKNLLRQLFPRFAVAAVGIAIVFLIFPSLRERLFYRTPDNLTEAVQLLNVSGRNQMWDITAKHALKRPILGWGPGSARPLIARSIAWKRPVKPVEYPPHNEYLQIFHDGGLIGLALFLGAWGLIAVKMYHAWQAAEKERHNQDALTWYFAGILTIFIVAINALVDNTLHYASVMCPVFILLGCAYAVHTSTPSHHNPRES